MSKITAWKCDSTGKIFEFEEDYKKHLRTIAAKRREERKKQKLLDEFQELCHVMQTTCKTTDEICQFIMNHKEHFVANGKRNRWHDNDKKPMILKSVEIFNVCYSTKVSNTHVAPKGKPTNWHRDADLPTGYEGWRGRIKFSFEQKTENGKTCTSTGNDFFSRTPIHTGSGGGGGWSYSYDVSLFAEEWPAMKELLDNEMVIDILKKE